TPHNRRLGIIPTLHQLAQLALPSVVRELDVPIFEEQLEALPLTVQVAESVSERSPRWNQRALLIEPRLQFLEDWHALAAPSSEAMPGVVACDRRVALDFEERCYLVHGFERQPVPTSRCLDEASAPMGPAARALSASALDHVEHARTITLDGAVQV